MRPRSRVVAARRPVRSLHAAHAARIDSDDVVDGYRLRWESTENQPVDDLVDWLGDTSIHPEDPFARRGTALLISTSSRAEYTEWIRHQGNTGTDRLRLLRFRSLEVIASGR